MKSPTPTIHESKKKLQTKPLIRRIYAGDATNRGKSNSDLSFLKVLANNSKPLLMTNFEMKFNRFVTICGVGGHTLFVGFHSFRFGWMNPRSGERGF